MAYDFRCQDTAGRIKRINGRINTLAGNFTGKYRRGIQMGKCRCRSRVGQVIGRHVNSLYRCDGSLSCGSNTLLQCAHLGCQRRLVSYCGRHTAKQSRNLGTCLRKSENIIDEQQHILIFHITEVFCHGKAGKSDTHTRSRRLVHLSIDQCCFVDNTALFHLVVKVISFTGTLSDTGENRKSAVCRCHVVDQLHDKDCFSNAGTTEQTDFSALGIRADQVNDLDSGFEDLRCRNLFLIGRRIAVDRPFFCCFRCRLIVYGLTEQVEHAA